MNDQELINAEEDTMLPDGWNGTGDFLDPTTWGNADGQPQETGGEETDAGESEPETVPTTDGEATETTGDVPPDTEKPAPDAATEKARVLTLKVNHQEETVDVNALSDEELIAILQKSRAFDESKKRDAYQSAYDKAMTETGDPLTSQLWAERKTGYRMPEESTGEPAEQTPENNHDALKAAEERAKAAEARIKELETSNRILKQNQAAAAKAPVRGVTGGGAAKPGNSMTDIMLNAFVNDKW